MHELLHDDGFWTALVVALAGSVLVIVLHRRVWFLRVGFEAGAVAALVGYHHPITVARAVMTKLPHVMLVGAGAALFASEIGAEPIDNLTTSTRKLWVDALRAVGETPASVRRTKHLLPIVKRVIAKRLGTVNFIALDKKGNIASAVTTSGWGYKYPGRVGDSPIIGAGNYCDTKAGGACCTGFGELAMRNVTAKTAVARLASGLSPAAAARRAIADANALANAPFNIVVLAADGTHASAANRADRRYAFMDISMTEAATKLRTVVGTKSRKRGAEPAQ
jgi:beta-aspartyl-peptidase (threonine type)